MIDERLREAIEVLDGSRRGSDRSREAVRVADLRPLLEIPDRLQAQRAAGAAPTAAEFDALLRDVEFLRARLHEAHTLLQQNHLLL